MRVAIVNLTGGGLSGGYRKYLKTLVPLLRSQPEISRLFVFIPPQATPFPDVSPELLSAWPYADHMSGYSWLKTRIRESAPDVVFIPTGRWLSGLDKPTVVMIRNMEPFLVPFGGNSLIEGMKNLARAWASRHAVLRATRVIAISGHVRDFLTRRWTVDPAKIGLVYHGVEPPLLHPQCVRPATLDRLEMLPFIFVAGSIRPARGLADSIQAMGILTRSDSNLRLVIGGKADRATGFYLHRMLRLAENLGVSDRVLWAGQLDPAEMSWCFRNCAVFVSNSRAEACPNTVLEAMSHGCQAVSTSQPPMPEFFAESALYYEPKNSRELALKITLALQASEDEKKRRRDKALERAAAFSWQTTAENTVRELKLAVVRHAL